MKKNLLALTSMLLFLPLLMGMAPAQQEQATQVQIILHKIVFPEGQQPQDTPNTGRIDDQHANLLKEYHGLNDVTFTVFDVSKEFYELREQGATVEQAQEKLAEAGTNNQKVASGITATVNGEDGTLLFSLPGKSVNAAGKDAVYLFHEAKAPDYIKEKSKDLVVVLPVYDGSQMINEIHLYPKNERKTADHPTFTKTIGNEKADYSYGDTIPFSVQTTIPHDLTDYTFFKVLDKADEALQFNPESLSVTIDGEDISSLYEKSINDHGFELLFNDVKKLVPYEGKTIAITYKDTLISQNKVDAEIMNRAFLTTDSDKIVKDVFVKTGGKRFVKVDAYDNAKKLSGAEFLITNNKGEYLTQAKQGFTWKKNATNKNVIKLVSDKHGEFEIRGLAYGTYQLEEIKAPSGYVKSNEKISFKITASSYKQKEGTLKVVNTAQRNEIPKTKKPNTGLLPKTNDMANSKLVWFGAFIILVVVIVFVRNKKGKE